MDKPKFVYVTYMATTPEKLWDALSNPEVTRRYWGNRMNASDWKVGSPWQHRDADNPSLVDIVGKVVESVPPRRLVLTWAYPADELNVEAHSRVTFDIEPYGDMVRLTVTHDEFIPGTDMFPRISRGWPIVLSGMKTLLETGRSLPKFDRRDGWPRQ